MAKCNLCPGDCSDPAHDQSANHLFNFMLWEWKTYKKALAKNRHGITLDIKPPQNVLDILGNRFQFNDKKGDYKVSITPDELINLGKEINFLCRIENTKTESVYLLKSDILYPHPNYIFKDLTGVLDREEGNIAELTGGATYKILVTLRLDKVVITSFKIPVSFNLQTDHVNNKKPDRFSIARSITIGIEETPPEEIDPEKSPFTNKEWPKNIKIVYPVDPRFRPLTIFAIPENYRIIIMRQLTNLYSSESGSEFNKHNFSRAIQEIKTKLHPEHVTEENYSNFFHILLWLEEAFAIASLTKYNMENVKLPIVNDKHLNLIVPGLAEKRPSIIIGDFVDIRVHDDHTAYRGVVTVVRDNSIDISYVHPECLRVLKKEPGMEMDVRFIVGRLPFVRKHQAVHSVFHNGLTRFLFPPKIAITNLVPINYNTTSFYDTNVATNKEQKQAVLNILNGTSGGRPYVVFGPPGTGKTVTIVEAMLQIKRETNKRILVCAPANAACNMLALKLIQYCKKNELIRVCSNAIDKESIPPEILPYTNCVSGQITNVSANDLHKFRIVVTTLVLIGKYSGQTNYNPDVIFVDEAAQACEPECTIPLGLFSKGMKQIVLAGDPQQLGAIVNSPKAQEYGLGKSLLKRLMDMQLYKPNTVSKKYNDRYITMLILNFRSHRKILEIPNSLFYENRLQPCSTFANNDPLSQIHVYQFINFLNKPKKTPSLKSGSPREFVSVIGKEAKEGRSPSFFNTFEINLVRKHIEALLNLPLPQEHKVIPSEIGIVTPYARQVYKLRHILHERYPEIEIGTTEAFQGREKRVIIISTVRGQIDMLLHDKKYNLGFVKNDERFNVAHTRAKSKLIVIGNPIVLTFDEKWQRYIDECKKDGTFSGATYKKRTKAVMDDITEKMRNVTFRDTQYQHQNGGSNNR